MGKILFFIISNLFFLNVSFAHLISDFEESSAIYGIDDRSFISSQSDYKIKKISESIAMIVSKDAVDLKWPYSRLKADVLSDENYLNLCPNQKFANHHSINGCTGFLIAPDLIASAGHCFLSQDDCLNKKIIFEVLKKNESKNGFKVLKQNIFECKEIVKSVLDLNDQIDYSVIRLQKKVTGRVPLVLSKKPINLGDQVFMIGHPLGLPQVLSVKSKVIDNNSAHFFKASIDSFEGNSGSPVINALTYEVEGILVRGEEDFESSLHQCLEYKKYEEFKNIGESVTRSSEIESILH